MSRTSACPVVLMLHIISIDDLKIQTIYTNIAVGGVNPTANDKANLLAAIEKSVKAPNSIPQFKLEGTPSLVYAFAANINKPV